MGQPFKILALDGGGFRGVYSAHILKQIHEKLDVNWCRDFDLIAGTSTGAILAAALVCDVSPGQILDMYATHGRSIFKRRPLRRFGLVTSRYESAGLRAALTDTLGDRKLGEIEFPLIIPATDIGNGCVHVFKSAYHPDFIRDRDVLVRDAVLASCSAPTYFDPHRVDEFLLTDGGLWANSPSLVAVVEAKRRLDRKLDDVRILSIGTGIAKSVYPLKRAKPGRLFGWGFAAKWGREKFISMLLDLQAQAANNTVNLLLNQDQILRLNFQSDSELLLDDPDEYNDLVTMAGKDFAHNAAKIGAFLA